MTIYVDELFTMTPRTAQARRFGNRWCHLFTDGDLAPLHQMAQSIGLSRASFQDHPTLPHYDLVPTKRVLAIKAGVREVKGEEVKAILLREVQVRTAERKKHEV